MLIITEAKNTHFFVCKRTRWSIRNSVIL